MVFRQMIEQNFAGERFVSLFHVKHRNAAQNRLSDGALPIFRQLLAQIHNHRALRQGCERLWTGKSAQGDVINLGQKRARLRTIDHVNGFGRQ